MSEIDWDKAPEGATHYCAKGSSHNGVEYGEHWLKPGFYRMPHWKKWEEDNCRAPESILVARPSPAWSGEGLPPVGVVCEVRQKTPYESSFEWEECRIAMINTGADGLPQVCTIDKRGDFAIYYPATDIVEFRPIRTPEQIAADEREAVVTYMQCIIGGCFDSQSIASPHEISEKLYEAGLRLIK